jgi:hypothetical protein
MKLLEDYFRLQKEIYDYFVYVEDWKVIPLADATDRYWHVDETAQVVTCAPEPLTKELFDSGRDWVQYYIYTQRFLPKFVYRGEGYTMISTDTGSDLNYLLYVFENGKEQQTLLHEFRR